MTLRHSVTRVARMDSAELRWRATAAARIAWDRARFLVSPPHWESNPDRMAAHRELSRHFYDAPQRFVIAPAQRSALSERIICEFPDAPRHAAARANRILAGEYDLLGYSRLRFDSDSGGIDWHLDPVHARRAPMRFWAAVPYLDPACGDHKIIWELNRHQHWLALGRAYWLTGDARYRERFIGELESWLAANPPLTGINWASMLELGFRSLSWIWALNFFADPDQDDRTPWLVDLLDGIDRQLSHVEHNLSFYFSPNTHLLGEALALYIAGRTIPELANSPRREALGRRILTDEIARQITVDGGHCERSNHYLRYTLDFYELALVVARITSDPIAPVFEEAVARLAAATRLLADNRGRLPLIGDDDGGALMPICGGDPDDASGSLAAAGILLGRRNLRVGPAPEDAWWMLGHPMFAPALSASSAAPLEAVASGALPDTGYFISRSSAGDHLVIDAGPHGYQNGGHAHSDALSLTFAVRGVPLLIDPGTGGYTTDPELRDRFRSTQFHNTVVVDDRPQSVPRGPFHWSHTAHATAQQWRTGEGGFDYFEGSHDGYLPIAHRRHVLAMHGDVLVVADLIEVTGAHHAAAHWHIDPSWLPEKVEKTDRRVILSAGGEQVQLAIAQGSVEVFRGDRAAGLGWHAPVYGRVEPATAIRITHGGNGPFWIVSVFGLDPDNAIERVDHAPVSAGAGTLSRSTAVRISRAASTDYCLFTDGPPAFRRTDNREQRARNRRIG